MSLRDYSVFIEKLISAPSKSLPVLRERLEFLEDHPSNPNLSLLLTGALGLSSETGEFNEIVKKICFQGKPLNEENIYHAKRELGDVLWYWTASCLALGLDPNDVMEENKLKLSKRFPTGSFSVDHSEHRASNDL